MLRKKARRSLFGEAYREYLTTKSVFGVSQEEENSRIRYKQGSFRTSCISFLFWSISKDDRVLLLSLHECSRKPIQSLIQTVPCCRTASLNIPLAIWRTKTMESKFIRHFGCRHSIRKILFVCKYKENRITKFIFVQHSVHLITGCVDTVWIIRINYEYKTLCILIVMTP